MTNRVGAYTSATVVTVQISFSTQWQQRQGTPVGNTGPLPPAHEHPEKYQAVREAVLAKAASVLGESEDDLEAALASGRSLADVAQEKNVALDDLKSAIAQTLKDELPHAPPQRIARLTSRMVQHHRHTHGPEASPVSEPPVSPTSASAGDLGGAVHVVA